MIKEAYVSYEISLLLDEKGFEEETTWYYNSKGVYEPFSAWVDAKPYDYSPMPTLQMACAWLREKHLIHVYAEHKAFFQEKKPKKLYYHWMPFVKTLPHCPINKSGFPKDTISLDVYCNTYEEAVGAALKYALENLI